MTKKEKERAIEFAPYMENVPENGNIKIESLYAFKDISVLYAFLYGCQAKNTSVLFVNEGIAIPAKDEEESPFPGAAWKTRLIIYEALKLDPHIAESYIRYRDEILPRGEEGPVFLSLPTIDAVPGVRCDKCRWHGYRGQDMICGISKDVVRSDDYCSHWEMKYK